MDIAQYDSQIKAANLQVATLRTQLDLTRIELLRATQRQLPDWFRKAARDSVASNPELAKSMASRLGDLKSEVDQLAGRVPQLVHDHLEPDRVWLHRSECPKVWDKDQYCRYIVTNLARERLQDAVQELLGYLGELLGKYGLVSGGYWELRPGQPPRYTGGYVWSTDMAKALQEYLKLVERFALAKLELRKLENEKAKAEAKILWDAA